MDHQLWLETCQRYRRPCENFPAH